VGLTAARALYRLDVPAFWYDEAVTWLNISGTWSHQIHQAARGDDLGGFLHSACLKAWSSWAGFSEFGLRFPSAIFALALVGVLWSAGRLLWGNAAGLGAAAAATLLPGFLPYAREARGYSLLMLAVAVGLLGLAGYWRQRRWGEWLLAIGAGGAVATHIFGFFALTGLAAAYLALVRRNFRPGMSPRAWLRLARSLVPPLILGLVWVFGTRKAIAHYLREFWLKTPVGGVFIELLPLLLLLAVALVLLVREERQTERRLGLTILTAAAIPIVAGPVAASLLSRGDHHFMLFRYFLALLPLAALAGGYILSRLRPPFAAGLAVALLAAVSFTPAARPLYAPGGWHDMPVRALVTFLRGAVSAHDRVLVVPSYEYLTLQYHGFVPAAWGDRTAFEFDRCWRHLRAGRTDRRAWLVLFDQTGRFVELPRHLLRRPAWSSGRLSVYRCDPGRGEREVD
jgi:hypothetical protein